MAEPDESPPFPFRRSRAGLVDTSPEAQRVLTRVFQDMPAEQKWRLVDANHWAAQALHSAGLRRRDPAASRDRIRDDWLRLMFGWVPRPPASGAPAVEQPAEVLAVLAEVIATLDRLGVAYALGGSMASGHYGEPRQTRDADLNIEPTGDLARDLPTAFDPAVYDLSADAIRDAPARGGSFKLLHTLAGFKVDFHPRGGRPFDHSVMARRQPVPFPGLDRPIFLVSPEDSILLKLERYRLGGEVFDRQWGDVLGVTRVQAGRLDEAYLDQWAAELGVADLLAEARAEAAE